ncbi:MAG: peptidylprolyl isomerase [Planctomycetota bacterium]
MGRRHMYILFASLVTLTCAPLAHAGKASLEPRRVFNAVNRPIPVEVRVQTEAESELALFDAETWERLAMVSVEPGAIDLAAMFPVLWTTVRPRVLYAQLIVGGEQVGSPLVLRPMLTPPAARDGLTDQLVRAAERGDRARLAAILSLSERERVALRYEVSTAEDRESRDLLSGWRLSVAREVILETTLGEVRLRVRHDTAPRTGEAFERFADGGLYRGTPFHRVVTDDGRGRPFIAQAGDPTGTGFGGAGARVPFERSSLEHGFGVVSMARLPDDPNSASGQFFICLDDESCASLDGQYAAFAEVVDGVDVLEQLSVLPTTTGFSPSGEPAPHRPLKPPVIERVRLEPAPPLDAWTPRVEPVVPGPIER